MSESEVHAAVRFNVQVVFIQELIGDEVAIDMYILLLYHWRSKVYYFMLRPRQ